VRKSEDARFVKIAGSPCVVGAWLRIALTCFAIAIIAGAVTAPTASAQSDFGAPLQRWFRLEWTVSDEAAGRRRVTGWIHNDYGTSAGEVRLVVEALDRSGRIVDRRYQWLPGSLPPLSRTYFDVSGLPAADSYRVGVHSFNIYESTGWL
jgi:hypothetical protein